LQKAEEKGLTFVNHISLQLLLVITVLMVWWCKRHRSFDELEAEMLQGQKLQGVSTAREVYEVLKHCGWLEMFPLFSTVHQICTGRLQPEAIVQYRENKL
jgi:hypothetical protein